MLRIGSIALACSLMTLASCGSGIIGGVLASDRGGSTSAPPVQQPQVVVEPSSVPVLPQSALVVTVRISNLQLNENAWVQLLSPDLAMATTRAAGVVPVVQGSVTRFLVDLTKQLAELRQELGRVIPESALVVDLRVFVGGDSSGGGQQIGTDVKITLNPPPYVTEHMTDELNGALVVSVDGTSRFRLAAKRMTASTDEAGEVELELLQRNHLEPRLIRKDGKDEINPDGFRVVRAGNKTYEKRDDGTSIISGVAPPSRFPGAVKLHLTDPRAGLTLGKGQLVQPDFPTLLYAPELLGVGPGATSLHGGELVTLRGRGLLPVRHELTNFEFLFSDVTLTVRRGDSAFVVSPNAILEDESNDLQIRFRVPPSPDGLPGGATLEFQQRLGNATPREYVVVKSLTPESGVSLRYRVAQPVLGPLANIIPQRAIGVRAGRFRPQPTFGDDLVLLSGTPEIGKVTLLRANGLGLYRAAGNATNVPTVSSPHGLLAGDFRGTSQTDLFVTGGSLFGRSGTGTHALVEANYDANSIQRPFRVAPRIYGTAGRIVDNATGDFDEDGKVDVVILPEPTGRLAPQLWLNVAAANAFPRPVGNPSVRGSRIHVHDLDGDDHLDIAIAAQEKPHRLYVFFGDGAGGFPRTQTLSYDPVKLELLEEGLAAVVSFSAGPNVKHRHLCVVASFDVLNATKWAVLLPMRFDPKKRAFDPPDPDNAWLEPSISAFTSVTTMDIVGDGTEELIAASVFSTLFPIRAYSLVEKKPKPLPEAVQWDPGILQITGLQPATIWSGRAGEDDLQGLLVVHESLIDARSTPVLSAMPKTSKGLGSRISRLVQPSEPDALAVGDLDGDGFGGDCAANDGSKIALHFREAPAVYDIGDVPTIDPGEFIPQSMATCPWRGDGDLLCWFQADGRLAIRFPGATKSLVVASDFRNYLPVDQRDEDVDVGTRIIACDPDENGVGDLCIFLQPRINSVDDVAALLFLRAKDVQRSGEMPFVLPERALHVPGQSRDPSIGSVIPRDANSPGLDLVLAQPDRLRVAYLDLAQPGTDVFRHEPTLPLHDFDLGVAARFPILDDLDDDGRDDLAFLMPSERRVKVFLNRSRIVSGKLDVRMVSFIGQSLTYLGDAFGLTGGDMDGDGLKDLFVAATLERISGKREPSPCLFRNVGRGSFSSCYAFPQFFLGTTEPKAFAVFDMDRNGMSDVILGTRVLLCR